jgi:type I restriction enzyme, S subunit
VQTGTAKGRRFGNAETIEVPYLRVANVQDGYLDLSEIKHIKIKKSEFHRYSLQAGDVLLTEGGDFDKLGRGYIWKGQIPNCIHQNHIFSVRVDRTRLLPEYLAYLVQSSFGKAYFLKVAHKTTNLASINSTKLKAFPTLIPRISVQEIMVLILQNIDAKILVETQRRSALEALFNSLLHHLMTGKVRVS